MSTWDRDQQEDSSRSGWRLRLAQRDQQRESPPLSEVKFLTVAEIALIMRVSRMTVYRLVHSGVLESARVGRSFRVPEEAVNQYLRAAFVAASPAS